MSRGSSPRRPGLDRTGHRARRLTLKLFDWAQAVLARDASVLEVLRESASGSVRPKLGLYLKNRHPLGAMGNGEEAFDASVECSTFPGEPGL